MKNQTTVNTSTIYFLWKLKEECFTLMSVLRIVGREMQTFKRSCNTSRETVML